MRSVSPAASVEVSYAFVGSGEEKPLDAGGSRSQMVERFVRKMRDAAGKEWSAASPATQAKARSPDTAQLL
jgi:hypothetical protein